MEKDKKNNKKKKQIKKNSPEKGKNNHSIKKKIKKTSTKKKESIKKEVKKTSTKKKEPTKKEINKTSAKKKETVKKEINKTPPKKKEETVKKRIIESSSYIEEPRNNLKEEGQNFVEQQLENKEVENKKRIWIIILLLLLLLLFFIKLNVKDILLGIPSKPVIGGITEQDSNWSNKQTVYIKEDSKGRNKIKYYLYCINKENSTEGCKWKKTETKNVTVTEHGKNFIFVQGVDEKGNISKPSDPIIVKIDNKPPTIEKVTTEATPTTIKVKVDAIDEDSGIDYYIYQIEGKDPIKIKDNTYTFKDLMPSTKYEITVIIVDKAGNKKEITMSVSTDKLEQDNNPNHNPDQNTNKDPSKDSPNKDDPNKKPTEQNPIKEEIKEIPEISLSGVPLKFKYGEKYKLPTSYKFGKSGGIVSCIVDNKNYQDTSTIPVGKREIICTAKSNTNISVTERKTVQIEIKEKEENIFDGWITLTLYYPENSTNWQYTIMDPNKTNSVEQKIKWNDYTGPITVRISDVENIYLKYTLETGEEVTSSPSGKLVAMPIAEKYSLKANETTTIKIYYSKEAEKKLYKINGGSWQEYKGEFQVGVDSFIEARAIKSTNIYDDNGNILKTEKETAIGNCYISEEVTKEEMEGG